MGGAAGGNRLNLPVADATWAPLLALLVALACDRWLGALPLALHPVAWFGRYLGWIGGLIAPRSAAPASDWRAFAAGALAWYGGAMLALLAAWILQDALLHLHPLAAGLLLGLALGPLLGWRPVVADVAGVEAQLATSLDAGRRHVGRIVRHDVMRLDAAQVRESAIATLAAQLNAALVAPVFWFVIAGLPGAVVYRFARTADGLWGYRGYRGGVHWEWAGKWAARADDVLGWVPARFTALLLAVAAGGISLVGLRRQARRAASPNAGWPVAALALALGTRLRVPGGASMNEAAASPAPAHTTRALRLAGGAAGLLLAWALLMRLAFGWDGSA